MRSSMREICINRNIVECKFLKTSTETTLKTRINRNIVECKSHRSTASMVLVPVLIETLWNVNLARAFCVVLIETLWNVNLESNSALLFRQIVLIETLWNVNTDP